MHIVACDEDDASNQPPTQTTQWMDDMNGAWRSRACVTEFSSSDFPTEVNNLSSRGCQGFYMDFSLCCDACRSLVRPTVFFNTKRPSLHVSYGVVLDDKFRIWRMSESRNDK